MTLAGHVTDKEDSPHLKLRRARARFLFAIAASDA